MAVVAAAACLALAACSPSPVLGTSRGETVSPSPEPRVTHAMPVTTGSPSPGAVPGAAEAADRARQAIQASVEKSVGGQKSPSSDAVRLAIAATLPPGSTVEVSRSVTPTGLAADAVVGAAIVAPGHCVFVYLRDGAVSSQLLPALSDGKCFVGDQH